MNARCGRLCGQNAQLRRVIAPKLPKDGSTHLRVELAVQLP
jgi:hypothetical protein